MLLVDCRRVRSIVHHRLLDCHAVRFHTWLVDCRGWAINTLLEWRGCSVAWFGTLWGARMHQLGVQQFGDNLFRDNLVRETVESGYFQEELAAQCTSGCNGITLSRYRANRSRLRC